MKLPRPGEDNATLASGINQLVEETSRDPFRLRWSQQCDRGMQLYLGEHFYTPVPSGQVYAEGVIDYKWVEDAGDPGEIRLVINRVLNIVLSLNAIQSADPPEITFTPRETGAAPRYFLAVNRPEAQELANELQQQGVDPEAELSETAAEWVRQRIADSRMEWIQAMQMGEQVDKPDLPPEVLCEVSDRTQAEALKIVFDGMAEECGFLAAYQENNLNKNIMGVQPLLVEFSDDTKTFALTNIHPKQWFPDRIKVQSDQWNYAIYDEPIDAGEAKAKWPAIADKIEQASAEGSLQWQQSGQYDHGAIYGDSFQRPMLVVRTAWLRNQPYPMAEEEAIAAGVASIEEGVEPSPCPQCQGIASEAGCPMCNGAGITEKPFRRLRNSATGEVFYPKSKKWPTRLGLRVVQCIAGEVVRDEESGMVDIPLPTNRCIPIPFTPYATGEPARLEGLQMAINRVISHIVTHEAYNAFPVEAVSSSVQERLGKTLQRCRARPGARLVVPADLVREIGDITKTIANLPVAALPADAWRLLDLLLSLIDREGNQADVVRGDASAQWSGEAIANLQNAATQVIRGKALFTEHFLKQTVKLMVHCIKTRMGAADIAKYMRKYPPAVITAMHDGIQRLEHDISVSITSGSGAARSSETQNLLMARQNQIPVSTPTVLERLGLDADEEAQKDAVYQRKLQQLQPVAAVAPVAQAPAVPVA
jgi:hypothetical protein